MRGSTALAQSVNPETGRVVYALYETYTRRPPSTPRSSAEIVSDPALAAMTDPATNEAGADIEIDHHDTRPTTPEGVGPRECVGVLVRDERDHLVILVTRPAPTVRPPSRMAKRRPSSIAMGWMSSTDISVLSPGMTISVPSGRVTTPVTSVVRK